MLSVDRQGIVDVYRATGPIKAEFIDECQKTVTSSIESGRPCIVFDLTEVVLLDSAALEWLLEVDEQCALRGGEFSVVGGNELIHDILKLTGVGNRLSMFDEVTDALRSFAQ